MVEGDRLATLLAVLGHEFLVTAVDTQRRLVLDLANANGIRQLRRQVQIGAGHDQDGATDGGKGEEEERADPADGRFAYSGN